MVEYLQNALQNLPAMQWSDYLDIIVVAFLFYKLLPIFRSSGATRLAITVVAVMVLFWLTEFFEMYTLNFIISQFLAIGLVAIVVLFQPELRRMLDRVTSIKFKEFFGVHKTSETMTTVITHTVKACENMSRDHVGALIVFERRTPLDEYFKTGTVLDAQVSDALIRNVFFPKAALHDGAMIVRGGRVAAAGCVLPLSETDRLSVDLGTRHRAAVGMSEASDAVVVIVSEETGAISVAVGGMLKRHLASQTLEQLLRNELCPGEDQPKEKIKLLQKLKIKAKEKDGDEK